MLNYIWFGLMAIALIVAIFTGNAAAVTKGAVDSAKTAVDISLGLIGIMTLWLGIMRVAEKAGLISLGLSNAATPLGIKAMEELQELNPQKETASNAMVTFMTLNTGGIQLIPATIIGVLAAAGSKNPTAIIATALIATICGTIAAVTTAKILQRFFPYEDVGPAPSPADAAEGGGATRGGATQ